MSVTSKSRAPVHARKNRYNLSMSKRKRNIASTDLVAPLISICGIGMSGDLGPYTTYTNKNGRIVFYPRSPPTSPPSKAQVKQRLRFRAAQNLWSKETKLVKAAWELFASKLRLVMTGQNLYMSLALLPASPAFASALHRTRMTLTAPTLLPR